jgi:putative ABC transport system permease protein
VTSVTTNVPILAVVLIALVAIAVAASRSIGLGVESEVIVSALRAVIQLAIVGSLIAVVLDSIGTSILFVAVMFGVAAATASNRIGAAGDWGHVALALACGSVPVLGIIFASGVARVTGAVIIPIAGIVIGGSMTAHTLTGRRAFDSLRTGAGMVEACLALGFTRRDALMLVISPSAPEALTPILDQTRTVGLVTLPGAFVGVLLGGGTVAEAAATQVLVLVGLVAAETLVVVGSHRLIASGRILPSDLRDRFPSR